MELRPILSAMSRNKFGAVLIAAQMAVTLGFLANALTLIEHRLNWSSRPSGVDEANVFAITAESIDHPEQAAARVAADLNALRSLPGVVDSYATNSYPLHGGGWFETVNLLPNQVQSTTVTSYYLGDEHALHTLGLHLVAGRNFTADEISNRSGEDGPRPGGVIVTRALANKAFPGGNALGQAIYVESPSKPERIIGIVDRLQSSVQQATGTFSTLAEYSVLAPFRPVGDFSLYMVRAAPGRLNEVMKAAELRMFDIDGNRIVHAKSMAQVRSDAYRGDRGLVSLLAAICAALLLVTAFGIVGLTSYWVAQRRQQIGIRRAVGATRGAIVKYFQTENLLIAGAGTAAGIAFAIALNLWMVHSFEMVRMDNSRALLGAAIMLLLGQGAVLWPALRAASIPPALATRGG
jgi:putative ABC transport system permease protein